MTQKAYIGHWLNIRLSPVSKSNLLSSQTESQVAYPQGLTQIKLSLLHWEGQEQLTPECSSQLLCVQAGERVNNVTDYSAGCLFQAYLYLALCECSKHKLLVGQYPAMWVLDCDLLTPVLVPGFCLPAQLQPTMQLSMTSFIQSMLTICISGIKNKSNAMAKI